VFETPSIFRRYGDREGKKKKRRRSKICTLVLPLPEFWRKKSKLPVKPKIYYL